MKKQKTKTQADSGPPADLGPGFVSAVFPFGRRTRKVTPQVGGKAIGAPGRAKEEDKDAKGDVEGKSFFKCSYSKRHQGEMPRADGEEDSHDHDHLNSGRSGYSRHN